MQSASKQAALSRTVRILFRAVPLAVFISLMGSSVPALGCDCDACAVATVDEMPLQAKYDFFTNYGQYMPRIHCLRTAEGSPDWPWISALIALNVIVVAGYLKIVFFWQACYRDEEPQDRNAKLMGLAWVFVLCAICGYGLSTLIFFWPAYRLLAVAMVVLAIFTWRFAIDLEPFRNSFTAHRFQRQLNEKLQQDNSALEAKHQELEHANQKLEQTAGALQRTNEDLDDFVYAASHDLKAPLRAVDSLSQFLLEDLPDDIPEGCREDLGELRGRVKRMENMLAAMLKYARLGKQDHQTETFNLTSAVQEAVDLMHIPEGFSIQIETGNLETTSARPPLEQVIRNLVDNAIKHHDRPDGTIRVEAVGQGDFVELSISDDGPGIEPEFHQKVFEMFETLRRRDEHESSGMGLAMVKRLVETQGGSIKVESPCDRGTTFRFTWPRNVACAADIETLKDVPETTPQTEALEPCHV